MSGFLYYEPRGEKLPEQYLDHCSSCITDVHSGPDANKSKGKVYGGHWFKTQDQAYRVKYLPKEQTWSEIPNSECWLGYYIDERPEPAHVERPKMLPGHVVGGFTVPQARDFTGGRECTLPRPWKIDKNGEWYRGEVIEEYRDLWRVSQSWWSFIGPESEGETMSAATAIELTVLALRQNYYVGFAELSMMEVLTDEFYSQALDAVCDIPSLNEILKKKRVTELLSIDAGQPEIAPATVLQ